MVRALRLTPQEWPNRLNRASSVKSAPTYAQRAQGLSNWLNNTQSHWLVYMTETRATDWSVLALKGSLNLFLTVRLSNSYSKLLLAKNGAVIQNRIVFNCRENYLVLRFVGLAANTFRHSKNREAPSVPPDKDHVRSS